MKTRSLLSLTLIALVLSIASFWTTAGWSQNGSVPSQDRITISQPQNSGVWKAKDLTVDYSYSRNQDQFNLSGKVNFADYMTLGYSLLQDFRLSAIFFDENGRVIETKGITTQRGSLESFPFRVALRLPSRALSMSFSYQGKAIESGGEDGGGGATNFWYNPIR